MRRNSKGENISQFRDDGYRVNEYGVGELRIKSSGNFQHMSRG